MSDADKWVLFVTALSEGRISVILEGATNSLDGGVIVTDADDVIDHITGGNGE